MKNLMIILIMTLTVAFSVDGWAKAEFQHKVIYEKRGTHIFLMCEVEENNNVVPQDFEHPVQIPPQEISTVLGKLKYAKSVLFTWRGDYDVFFESERENLSKHISQAFQTASSNEWIKFASTVMSRDSVDPVPLLTDGYIFKKKGKLHVVLLNVKKENTKDNRPRGGDPRKQFSLQFKRINLTEEISYPPVLPGSRFLEKPHNNWAMIDMDALSNPIKEPDAKPAVPMKDEKKGLIERLKILKELYNKDLITEEEYEKKKGEILNEL